jgi:hypothetical protein
MIHLKVFSQPLHINQHFIDENFQRECRAKYLDQLNKRKSNLRVVTHTIHLFKSTTLLGRKIERREESNLSQRSESAKALMER